MPLPAVPISTPNQLWETGVTGLQALPAWQAAVIIVTVSAVTAFIIQVGGDRAIRRFTTRIEGEIDDIVLGSLHPPLYVSVILGGIYLTRDVFVPEGGLGFGIGAVVLSVLIIVWSFALIRIGRRVSNALTADTDRDQSVVPIFQNLWTVALLGGAAYLLSLVWAVNVTPLLASAGVLGLILGFAARDTIANFFGSIALYFDGTYAVGDYVVLESGERGRVDDISIRSTVIRTRDDVLVTIPNAKLNSSVIINESDPRTKYRLRTKVGVAYGSDLEHVEAELLGAAEDTSLVLSRPRPRVRFREFGESALELELLCWVRDPVHRGRGTHEVNKAIYTRFSEAGIQIPFPHRSIHVLDGDARTPAV